MTSIVELCEFVDENSAHAKPLSPQIYIFFLVQKFAKMSYHAQRLYLSLELVLYCRVNPRFFPNSCSSRLFQIQIQKTIIFDHKKVL